MDKLDDKVDRRKVIRIAVAGAATFSLSRLSSTALADEAADLRPQPGDRLVLVSADGTPKPLRVDDIPTEAKPIQAFPYDPTTKTVRNGSRLNKVLLVRLPIDPMDATTRAHSADGVVAYSAICTHQGCDVSEWIPQDKTLLCFCHFSKYNPFSDADVTAGPAPRNLPNLPLESQNGELLVAALFSSAPGPRNTS